MRVLVTVASRHGSTAEVSERIANTLVAGGIEVDVRAPDEVTDLSPYDAVLVGSAVYMGRWLDPARRVVERHEDALRERPVWLFSVGPLGDPPHPTEEPVELPALAERVGARGRQMFAGKLGDQLGLGERAVVRMVKAPRGDFRDWRTIDAWTNEVALELAKASMSAELATVR